MEIAERRLLMASDVFLVNSAADDGPGSLRWAIGQVNSSLAAEPATIRFAIPGDGPAMIRPLSPLDPIVKPVFVEARSAEGAPTVRLDGASAGAGANGLVVSGGGSVVAGLIVTGFSGAGVVLSGAGGDFVESCHVGLTPGDGETGPKAVPNAVGILIAASSDQTVGGLDGRGNVIAGNRGAGVLIVSATPGDSADDVIVGNWIGTDAVGTPGIGNGQEGVVFQGAVRGRIEGNVVSGNQGSGIVLNLGAAGNQVIGNVVGLAPDRLSPLGNRRDGVVVDDAPGNTIGGRGALANQISANGGSGVRARAGSTGLTILGNWIGVDPTGLVRLGNQGDGVTLATSDATVGGPDRLDGNTIAFNGQGTTGAGVQLVGAVHRDAILSNRIYGNAGLGINLGNGPTPYHDPLPAPSDQAVGPNDWTNRPTLFTAFTDGVLTTTSGVMRGIPNQTYTIQFFWTSSPDASGFGEGERYLGQTRATTDPLGVAVFTPLIGSDSLGGFLTATATDEAGNTSEFALSVLLQPYTDLHVELTANPPSGPRGTAVTFTATVTNRGYLTAPNTAMTLSLPAGSGLSSISGGPGAVSTASGPAVRLDVGSLAAGASAVLVVAATPPPGASGAFTAVAAATMTMTDARPGDESASVSAVLTPASDVTLALESGPTAAHRGDVLTYAFLASNAGPATASGVRLTLPIPAGASFSAARTSVGHATLDAASGLLRVDLGDLAPGASTRIEIDLTADAVGDLATVATLSSASFDLDPDDQAVPLATIVTGRAALALTMNAPRTVVAGRDLTYAITVLNAGPDPARDVSIQDLIPTLSDLVSADLDGVAATFADGIVTARIDSLAAGASATLRIVVRPAAALGATLRNATRVSSIDDDPSDDSAWRDTVVREASDLGVTVATDSMSVLIGRDATYRIQVRNDGPATEPDAVLAVALPTGANLRFAGADRGAPATVADGLAVFRLGALAPGDVVDATIILTPSALGPLSLTAVVGGLNVDEDASDQRATAVANVLPTADLATYVDPPLAVYERSPFQYTLTAANLSANPTTGVRLTAILPAGVEFVSAVSSQGGAPTVVNGVLVAPFGTLAGSSTATVTITVRPTVASGSVLLLSGVSTSDLADPAPGNDRGGYAVRVAPAVDLMIRLRPLQTGVELGGDVTWVAEVWNSSTTTATGLTISVPHLACGAFVGAATTRGTVAEAGGVFTASVGSLAPGESATIAFVLRPNAVGVATLIATAAADQHVNLTTSGTLSADLTVVEPPGTLAFATSDVAVPETAGTAYLTVVRTGGGRGLVSVGYRTVAGSAAPGVDYQETSGVLTFQPGQTSAVIAVPVLPFAHHRGDVALSVVLDGATAGATLGPATTAALRIQDVDPDVTPPSVGRIELLGPANAIGGLTLTLSEPITPASAFDPRAYSLIDLGPNGVYGDGDDAPIALQPPGYDFATNTVYLTPTAFLPLGRHYAVVTRGTGPDALVDLAGNPLGGGVDFVALFARGATLKYTDATGDAVSLTLKNGGFLDLVRAASGDATGLTLRGIVAGRSTLSGTVTRPRGRGGDGVTPLGAIEGLGSFGDVRVSLKAPPFLAAGLPSPPGRTGRIATASARVAPLVRRLPSAR